MENCKNFKNKNSHTFFGYYDINPFSSDETKILALSYQGIIESFSDPRKLDVGYFFLKDPETFHKVGETTTWCWQQGARLRWFSEDPERLIIYNKMIDGVYGAVVQDICSKEIIKSYKRAFYDISSDGKYGLSLNFSRLQRLRQGYGYCNITDETNGVLLPENDGIIRIDMATGEEKFLFSIKESAEFHQFESMKIDAEHYFNHISFNPSGTRFLYFHIWMKHGKRLSRAVTVDLNGENMWAISNQGWVSHYDWKGDKNLLLYAFQREADKAFYEYEDLTDNRKQIGEGLLFRDGHPTYNINKDDILVDAYSKDLKKQHLYLYNQKQSMVKLVHSSKTSLPDNREIRCDLHPRWSSSGKWIAIDTMENGKRVLSVLEMGA